MSFTPCAHRSGSTGDATYPGALGVAGHHLRRSTLAHGMCKEWEATSVDERVVFWSFSASELDRVSRGTRVRWRPSVDRRSRCAL